MRIFLVPVAVMLASQLAITSQTRRTSKPAPAAAAVPADAAPFPIESLSVQGNHLYSANQIVAASGIHLGQAAGTTEFEAARQRLAATGAFDKVGYRYAPAKDGKGYDATIEVTEMPQVYPVRFEDLPATDTELRTLLKAKDPLFGDRIPATKPELDRYVRMISDFLAARDYHEAIIGKTTSDATTDLMVVFRPARPRPNVARVKFINTGDVPSGILQTKMYGVAVGMPFVDAQFRLLLETAARPVYEARGMIRVQFPKIEIAPSKDVEGVDVTVSVEPGPVYKLQRVSFAGAEAPREPFAKLANLKTNQTANFDEIRAAQDRIAQSFRRSGYLDASSEIKRDVNDTDRTVSVTLQIMPGPLYTLGQLDILGLDIESEPVIRKMWGIAPGKPFNAEYPDHFLDVVKKDGVFDNLKTTRSETNTNRQNHTVDVTLYFNK